MSDNPASVSVCNVKGEDEYALLGALRDSNTTGVIDKSARDLQEKCAVLKRLVPHVDLTPSRHGFFFKHSSQVVLLQSRVIRG